jgi:hypothetical protein
MLTVVCMKWHNRGPRRSRVPYTAQHVNRFASMVRRNLDMPHRIVCITDDPKDIDPSVEVMPIWPDLMAFGSCYLRLKLFSGAMRELLGERFVSIDLDCVIVDKLDPLFDRPDDFVMWKNVGKGCLYCGSMFLMTAGARAQVWDRFTVDDLVHRGGGFRHRRDAVWAYQPALRAGNVIGSDQAVISTILGPGEAMWRAGDGVMSFKADVLRTGVGKMVANKGADLPEIARIVFFHGAEDPRQKKLWAKNPWIEKYWR